MKQSSCVLPGSVEGISVGINGGDGSYTETTQLEGKCDRERDRERERAGDLLPCLIMLLLWDILRR